MAQSACANSYHRRSADRSRSWDRKRSARNEDRRKKRDGKKRSKRRKKEISRGDREDLSPYRKVWIDSWTLSIAQLRRKDIKYSFAIRTKGHAKRVNSEELRLWNEIQLCFLLSLFFLSLALHTNASARESVKDTCKDTCMCGIRSCLNSFMQV